MPRSLIAGLNGRDMFNFVRSHQTVFQSGCTVLHPQQHWMRAPVASHPYHQAYLTFRTWDMLIGVWFHVIVIICNYNLHFFLFKFKNFFAYFMYKYYIKQMFCKYFLPVSGSSFQRAEDFKFNEVQLIIVFFHGLWFWCV